MVGCMTIRIGLIMTDGVQPGCIGRGVRVIRLAAESVKTELDGVLGFIARVARERSAG